MRRWFYTKVVKYRKPIMVFFVLLAIASAFMYPKVYVDYELINYLPKDTPSTTALEVMEKEFGADIPNTQVVVCDVSRREAEEYKEKIEATDGVLSVMWIDSLLPINMPLEMLPEGMTESYFKDGNAQFVVTVDSDKQLDTIPALYDIIGEDNMLAGSAALTVVATINTVKEVILITIIAIFFLLFVLILTTTSWTEPFVILFGLGIAVIINAGTNLIFGKISFVTNSTGMILQMAVALDYSVFLIHRFEECLKEDPDPEKAMVEALTLSSSSIMSSGLTTVIGFLALAFMEFLIGADLGIALSKGVAISLITTLIFMPGVILGTYRLMERTRHMKFLPPFDRFGRFVLRVTVPLMVVFAIAIVPSFIGSRNNQYLYGGSRIYGPDTRIGADIDRISEIFGDMDSYVMMVPRGDVGKERTLIQRIEEDPKVLSVISPESVMGSGLPSDVLPDDMLSQLRSENYDRLLISVAVPMESDETFELVESLRRKADRFYPGEYYLTGNGVNNYDLKVSITGDMLKVNLIAVIAVFVVLLLTMQNLVLPVILVLVIETAIWFNLSISWIMGSPLFYLAYLIISSVQLGATVDYAILLTQRYRENRNMLGISPRECIVKTISDNTVSIMTSAFAVSVMGFLLAIFSSQRMIAQVGLLLGRGTLCSLFAVLFVLPGLLMTFDRQVIKSFDFSGRIHGTRRVDRTA